mmetsp:Transcript_21851/g.61048  ORF Transcript_21851/g.61048 Transcript_21851/m.61048 type:complete len:215 (-) Transcript_21851:771-1415(-)
MQRKNFNWARLTFPPSSQSNFRKASTSCSSFRLRALRSPVRTTLTARCCSLATAASSLISWRMSKTLMKAASPTRSRCVKSPNWYQSSSSFHSCIGYANLCHSAKSTISTHSRKFLSPSAICSCDQCLEPTCSALACSKLPNHTRPPMSMFCHTVSSTMPLTQPNLLKGLMPFISWLVSLQYRSSWYHSTRQYMAQPLETIFTAKGIFLAIICH